MVNLAAQAGVRYSIDHPDVYIQSTSSDSTTSSKACRHTYDLTGMGHESVQHHVAVSSSSVYSGNEKVPFSEYDHVDHPVSLYAATKKPNEFLAHAYAKLYDIPATMLCLFTVIGGTGSPDMALMGFADKLRRGETTRALNHGDMRRDYY